MTNKNNIYAMLHEFRTWNREWDTFMRTKPQSADDFVEHLSKLYEVTPKLYKNPLLNNKTRD